MFWGSAELLFLFYPPSPLSRALVEITKHKETEADDFRFSIIIFGEQIKDLSDLDNKENGSRCFRFLYIYTKGIIPVCVLSSVSSMGPEAKCYQRW